MGRLMTEELKGIWAGVTMVWNEQYEFDEETFANNTKRMLKTGISGIYTTGSTGEFYALEFDEFKRMVDIEAELCRGAGLPLQIGCCSDVTAKTLRMLEYAAGTNGVSAVQAAIPYWMELTDRELLQFFKDLHCACPDLPLVHYNIPRTKRFLLGPDYRRVLEVAPNLIGVKFTFAGSHFGDLQDAIILNPELSFFVGENLLVSGMLVGARGCYSSIVATDPKFMLGLYKKAESRQWDEAAAMQRQLAIFIREASDFISERNEILMDPVFDKGLGVASGCLLGHQRCRPPYIGWSDETVRLLREWLKGNYPQFVYPDK